MSDPMFREWRFALLGSLGLMAACGGEATSASDSTNTGSASATGTGGATATTVTASSGHSATTSAVTSGTGTGSSVTGVGGTGMGGTGTGGTSTTVEHRVEPAVCEPFEPSDESAIPDEYASVGGAGGFGPVVDFTCEFDAECNGGINGDCAFYSESYDYPVVGTACRYGCNEDADCAAGKVCDCVGGTNRCIDSTCVTDGDCPSGDLCIKTEYNDGCGNRPWFACQSALDECAEDSDCMEGQCGFDRDAGHHKCITPSCVIGRPFLVYTAERRAKLEARRDWLGEAKLALGGLTSAEQSELAARWQTIGLMEHASIAAFARFALQLLSLGAPAELLERTHQALADETRHARLAFGIASRYSGRTMGPGPLNMDGALAEDDLVSVVLNAVLEGCIGETVAAAEARLGAESAEDPALAEILAGIAADESRHAELAFAFVRWAVQREPRLAPRVLETVRRELRGAVPAQVNSREEWLVPHGLLPEHQRAPLRRAALEQMVMPCLRAICAVSGSEHGHEVENQALAGDA